MLAALTFVLTANLSYTNIVLTHLLFLEDQDWDVHAARESINYPDITEKLSDYFVACDQLLGCRRKIIC
ncbi:hypothetical protein PC116_g32256 [Phytophthora cactorum]|nr:hypothetical protein PC116_g32256 [Phytophthora cactorum]